MAWSLAGVLRGCTALAHLDVSENEIDAEAAGRLEEVFFRKCKALAHLAVKDGACLY